MSCAGNENKALGSRVSKKSLNLGQRGVQQDAYLSLHLLLHHLGVAAFACAAENQGHKTLQSEHVEKVPAQRRNIRRIERFDGDTALEHDLSAQESVDCDENECQHCELKEQRRVRLTRSEP